MRGAIIAASAVAGVVVPTHIRAQPSLYTMNSEPAHGTVVRDKDKATEARRVMLGFGRCVLDRYPRYSANFLAELPDTVASDKAAEALATSECLDRGTLRYPTMVLRGALFEAMYLGRKARRLTPDVVAAPAVDYRPPHADPAAAPLTDFLAAMSYADCVARASPTTVDAILMSTPGSTLEATAFRGTTPALASCLAEGVQTKFTKVALRGMLAEAAYRIANPTSAIAVRE